MSWLTKAENLLNKIDQSAEHLLKVKDANKSDFTDGHFDQSAEHILNKPSSQAVETSESLPKPPIVSKNIMVLSKKKASKVDLNEKWGDESHSETTSRRSSISSRHDTIIDKGEDHKTSQLKESLSNASLNSFSVEKELVAMKILASELRSENNELKSELEAAIEQAKLNGNLNKTEEVENLCSTLQEEKEELTQKLHSLEISNSKYVKTISDMEAVNMKMQQNENELTQKIDYAKNEARDAINELQQYRLRAQNQLLLKEKLIEQLKSGHKIENNENDETILELNQLRVQRDHLQSELNLLTRRFDDSKNFIEKMEHKHRMISSEAEDKMMSFKESIEQLSMKNSQYEDEISLQKSEISQVRDEMQRLNSSMTTKLHEKENELKRLKNSYRESQVQGELENRMDSLTQSLISKQNNLENVTAERNALKFQLEKLTLQHEDLLLQTRPQRQLIINMNETDDAKSQFPNFMIPNPFDSRMSRRVKRAYSNLDQVGVKIGVFLRRYPLARILSVFYVIFLHVFVFFVLVSSTPSQ